MEFEEQWPRETNYRTEERGVGGSFKSSLQLNDWQFPNIPNGELGDLQSSLQLNDWQFPNTPNGQLGDGSDPFYKERRDCLKNPTNGSWGMVQILST